MGNLPRDKVKDYFRTNVISFELFDLMIGDHIATGAFREVFYYRPDHNFVIKFELNEQSFDNSTEWRIWNYFAKKPLGKWLAPCVEISPCGVILIQRHCADVVGPELPAEVPHLFTDLKPSNWGLYKKRVVCRDYANLRLMEQSDVKKMRPANWKWKTSPVKE